MDNKLIINKYNSECLAIVESVLTEEPINEKEFLEKCEFITKSYYNDIITERSIIHLCGYALCPNTLSVHNSKLKSSQKYHISLNYNRVYEITERKMFCSNLCFKSSNYLREQISEEPLWMRNESIIKNNKNNSIHLYNKSVGQLGHEIVFDEHIINESNFETIGNDVIDEKEDSKQKPNKKLTNNKNIVGFPYIKEEYLNELKTQMKDLTINERLDNRQKALEVNESKCSSQSNVVLKEHKKSNKTCEETISPKSRLELIEKTLNEWMTSSTHKFVFGSKDDEENCSQMSESLDELNLEEEEEEEREKKLEQMKYTYMMICHKLDLEEKKDQLFDEILLGKKTNGKSAKELAEEDYIPVSNDDFSEKFEAFKKGKLTSSRNRKVRFHESVKSDDSELRYFVPSIDTENFNHKRRQIVLSSVEKVLIDLFDAKYLEELRVNLKLLISTFKFTANNVVLQTQQSLLMCLFLTRMLIISKKLLFSDDLFNDEPILSVLNSYNLNTCEMDEKILSYLKNI